MTEAAAVTMNPKALVPLALITGGYFLLLLALLLLSAPVPSMIGILLGGAVVAAGSVLMPPTPAVLPVANIMAAVLLLLQVVGACTLQCGSFAEYQHLAGILPTAWMGLLAHAAMALIGILRPRWPVITANVYRTLLGGLQGVSLFFALLMVAYGHWCPSCAAAHAVMLGQAIVLVRLTTSLEEQQRTWAHLTIYGLAVAAGLLAMNAAFHHPRPLQAPGGADALIGYLERARLRGETLALPAMNRDVRGAEATAAPVTAPAASVERPAERSGSLRDDQARRTLGALPALRLEDFDRWGSPQAPVVLRAHMSPTCPGCRMHWPDVTQGAPGQQGAPTLRQRVEAGEVQVRFIFTWPVTPRTHYGASLATSVLYACGMLGEEELLLAGDRFFSADGAVLLDQIDRVLADEASRGPISVQTEREALAKLIEFLSTSMDASAVAAAYVAYHQRFDDLVKANVSWLFDQGRRDTPHYFFVRSDSPDGRPYLDTSSLDSAVVGAYLERGLQPLSR